MSERSVKLIRFICLSGSYRMPEFNTNISLAKVSVSCLACNLAVELLAVKSYTVAKTMN